MRRQKLKTWKWSSRNSEVRTFEKKALEETCVGEKEALTARHRESVQRPFRVTNKRIIFVGEVGVESLITALLLHLQPNRPVHECPAAGHLATPKTMKTQSHIAGRVNFEQAGVETFAFFDTRGLYDAFQHGDITAGFDDLMVKELCKADRCVVQILARQQIFYRLSEHHLSKTGWTRG